MRAFARAMGAFRLRNASDVQAEVDARLARVDGDFEQLLALTSYRIDKFRAVGALPDRRKHPRKESLR